MYQRMLGNVRTLAWIAKQSEHVVFEKTSYFIYQL